MPRLIDADALADELAVLIERNTELIDEWFANLIEDAVDDAPTIDKPIWNIGLINNGKLEQVYEMAIVRHGHWVGKPIAGYSTVRCSVCGEAFLENNGKWKYCPNCGAKMGEVEDEIG